jgi:cellulose synthase (UDP-forming)
VTDTDFVPLLLVMGGFALLWDARRDHARVRLAVTLVPALLLLPYMVWRVGSTLLTTQGQSGWAQAWIWAVGLVELLALWEMATFLLIMSRVNTRSAQADALQGDAKVGQPEVDVFIPTYNEPLDVLEKTILGAKAIDYPNKTVWVLDDGRRDSLRAYCERQGVRYLTRPDNLHAKAGNINHALQHARGAFVCVFDADFVPSRGFIRRTLGLFSDDSVGIVQTPQHFYNKDPVQTNLGLMQDYPDEQRLFFDQMAASRDAWDASFCCGSCSILRRQALDVVGGIPTESITEDLLTTLVMLRHGYRTVYLNERLSMGLAAESIEGFFVQRERWCQGAIQSLFLRWGPLGPGLTPMQRFLFFPTSWLTQYFVRLFLLLIPLVYLLLGWMPLQFTSTGDLVRYQLPLMVGLFLTTRWLVGSHYVPLVSVPASIFASFRLAPTVVASLIRPFGKPFRVTPKGALSVGGRRVDVVTLTPILITMGLTLLGLLINVTPELAVVPFTEFFPIAVFWSGLNVFALALAALLCIEGPRLRREERFVVQEPAVLHWNGQTHEVWLVDASLDGFHLRTEHGVPPMPCIATQPALALAEPPAEGLALDVRDVGVVALEVVRSWPGRLSGRFVLSEPQREAMIRKLFGGDYSNHVTQVQSWRKILHRLWAKAMH